MATAEPGVGRVCVPVWLYQSAVLSSGEAQSPSSLQGLSSGWRHVWLVRPGSSRATLKGRSG